MSFVVNLLTARIVCIYGLLGTSFSKKLSCLCRVYMVWQRSAALPFSRLLCQNRWKAVPQIRSYFDIAHIISLHVINIIKFDWFCVRQKHLKLNNAQIRSLVTCPIYQHQISDVISLWIIIIIIIKFHGFQICQKYLTFKNAEIQSLSCVRFSTSEFCVSCIYHYAKSSRWHLDIFSITVVLK